MKFTHRIFYIESRMLSALKILIHKARWFQVTRLNDKSWRISVEVTDTLLLNNI